MYYIHSFINNITSEELKPTVNTLRWDKEAGIRDGSL